MLGYDHPASAVVVPDERPVPRPQLSGYRPSAHPGARLPHAWLPDGRSVYDLLGEGFALLRLGVGADPGPLVQAAARASVPLRLVDLAALPGLRPRYGADLVLVRPDQHVAWRGDALPDVRHLLERVTGAVGAAAPGPVAG